MGAAVGARASAAHPVTSLRLPSVIEAREVVRQAEPVETGALDAGRGAEAISHRGNASWSAIVSVFLLELYRISAIMPGLFPVIVFTSPWILGNLFIWGGP